MKRKNIFFILAAAVMIFTLGLTVFAQGSVNSNNDGAPYADRMPGEVTTNAFSSDGVTSGVSDPATQFDESDEVTYGMTEPYRVTDTDADTRMMPETSGSAVTSARPRPGMAENRALKAILAAVLAAVTVTLIVLGVLMDRRRERQL